MGAAETQDFGIPDLDSLWEQMSCVGPAPTSDAQLSSLNKLWIQMGSGNQKERIKIETSLPSIYQGKSKHILQRNLCMIYPTPPKKIKES